MKAKLEKLKIHVYKDRKRSKDQEVEGSPFKVMFNPDSYSLKYENVFQAHQGINTSAREAKYSLSKPSTLSLKLILDNSGVVEASSWRYSTGTLLTGSALVDRIRGKNDISKRVAKFLSLTSYMDQEIHEPKFIKIEWGDLIFKCRLASVEVNYTLFNRSGQPLRAELQTEFEGDIEDSERVKKENKNSPDLTHERTVMSGDTLPLMANRIYRDSTYYLKVAQANKLNNFRKLKTGKSLYFPPIKDEKG